MEKLKCNNCGSLNVREVGGSLGDEEPYYSVWCDDCGHDNNMTTDLEKALPEQRQSSEISDDIGMFETEEEDKAISAMENIPDEFFDEGYYDD